MKYDEINTEIDIEANGKVYTVGIKSWADEDVNENLEYKYEIEYIMGDNDKPVSELEHNLVEGSLPDAREVNEMLWNEHFKVNKKISEIIKNKK